MNRQYSLTGKLFLSTCLPFLVLSFSMSVIADTSAALPTAGSYYPDTNVLMSDAIMQNDRKGEPMVTLKQVRHMLACDGLDLPLQ